MDLMQTEAHMHKTQADVYPVDLPDGKVGVWSLSKVTVAKTAGQSITNMRYIRDGVPEFVVSPGTYQRLIGPCIDGKPGVMMSNTQLEYRTNKAFVDNARGDVLIVGLGIGMLIRPLAANKLVKSITVLELEPDVMKLVKPHYLDVDKLRVYGADAFDFEPGDLMGNLPDSWDCIMVDIWPDVSPANLPSMTKLRNRYRQFLNKGGKVTCWSMEIAQRMQRIEREEEALFERLMNLTQPAGAGL